MARQHDITRAMSENPTHPYTLEVQASERPAGTFQWAIRKHGKLVQRSDRTLRSEADAQKSGEKEIERLFTDVQTTR